MKAPDKKGIHVVSWNMDEKGPKYPKRKIRKNNQEGSGVNVRPGKYKLIMEVGELKDESSIVVKSDPRLTISSKTIEDSYKTGKKLEKFLDVVDKATVQLAESLLIAKDFEKSLSTNDSISYKDQIILSKEIVKKINSVQDLFFGKIDKRQGIIRSPKENVLSRIRKAYYYSTSRPNGITTTENTLIKQAKSELDSSLKKVNVFFNQDWKQYQLKMDKLSISPFKTTQKFNINN